MKVGTGSACVVASKHVSDEPGALGHASIHSERKEMLIKNKWQLIIDFMYTCEQLLFYFWIGIAPLSKKKKKKRKKNTDWQCWMDEIERTSVRVALESPALII